MALDPRIALQGASFQAPDIQGALARGQEYRQNQMTMQAAQDTAARNVMLRELQGRTDFNDRNSVANYMRIAGAEGAPVVAAMTGADTMFNTRAAAARDETKFNTQQSTEYMAQLPQFASQLLGDASPPAVARVRAQWEGSGFPVGVFDALSARLADLPPEQQQQALQSYLLTTGGGKTAVETRFGPRTLVNTGATQVGANYNPLALDVATGAPVPLTGAIQNTPDPRAPTIFSSSQGVGQIAADGSFTPVTGPGGAPVMPYQAPSRTDAAAGEAKTMAAEGLRSTLDSLRGYYDALNRSGGIVSTERGAGRNVAASAAASLPGRVLGRTLGFEDQTQRDNIQTAIPMIVASLKDLTGMSAQQMNSNVELQLFLGTVGDPSKSIETVNEALARFERYVDRVAGEQGGGGADMPPVGARGATLTNSQTGATFVSDGTRWVPR